MLCNLDCSRITTTSPIICTTRFLITICTLVIACSHDMRRRGAEGCWAPRRRTLAKHPPPRLMLPHVTISPTSRLSRGIQHLVRYIKYIASAPSYESDLLDLLRITESCPAQGRIKRSFYCTCKQSSSNRSLRPFKSQCIKHHKRILPRLQVLKATTFNNDHDYQLNTYILCYYCAGRESGSE